MAFNGNNFLKHVLLLFVFYLIITPLGVVLRLFRYDPLRLNFDHTQKTYWVRKD